MRSILLACLSAAASLDPQFSGAHAAGQEREDELIADTIHSDLPLYTFGWKELWPRSFQSGDSFGCSSRVSFGDWRFTSAATRDQSEVSWERYSNYGVFHCAAVFQSADERPDLEEAPSRFGFFVQLGTARTTLGERELWAIQLGMRPGSQYRLLARPAGQKEAAIRFDVLQQRCPRQNVRQAENLDVWATRYCAINSRRELLALARKMVRLRPLGMLERVDDPLPSALPD